VFRLQEWNFEDEVASTTHNTEKLSHHGMRIFYVLENSDAEDDIEVFIRNGNNVERGANVNICSRIIGPRNVLIDQLAIDQVRDLAHTGAGVENPAF
jgi:hypothetical protein